MKDLFNEIDLEELQLVAFSPKTTLPDSDMYDYYVKFFNFWKQTWFSAYKNLGVAEEEIKIYTDELFKQDEIIGLFYKGELVGGAANTRYDLSNEIDANASYFKNWHELTRKQVTNKLKTSKIFACGNFTITSNFSSKKSRFPWKALVLILLMERSLMQTHGKLISCTNSNKKVTQGSVDMGAKVIVNKQLFELSNGVQDYIDIVSTDFEKMSNLRESNPLYHLTIKLFSNIRTNSLIEIDRNLITRKLTEAS